MSVNENKCCSSCDKENSQLKKFGNNIYLCQKCIDSEKYQNIENTITSKSLTPKILFEYLNQKIIGQTQAKKALSIAIATHHCRLTNKDIQKSNILLIGPTGTGKTEMARNLAKITGVPFAIIDATTLTAHGYIGEDVESCLHQLLIASNYNLQAAEQGIVFIDEIDKLARGQEGSSENGIATVRVQQSLLKMMEGGKVKLAKNNNGSKSNEKEYINFDTTKVLFICSGAFPELEEQNKKSLAIGIGFNENSDVNTKNNNEVKTSELTKYGLIPEFLGRLPVVVKTQLLTEKDLIDILTKIDNSLIDQYKLILKSYGVNIEFTKSFLNTVAKEAFENKLGARGLRSILEKKLQDLLFEGPSLANTTIQVHNDGFKVLTNDNITPIKSKTTTTKTPKVEKQKNTYSDTYQPQIVAEDKKAKAIKK